MKKFEKIKTYKEIKGITLAGKKHVLDSFIIYETSDLASQEMPYIGILISKKFGIAVKRNFAKRRILAMLNDLNLEGLKGKKITFIPRNKILKIDYKKIASEFTTALKESFKAV